MRGSEAGKDAEERAKRARARAAMVVENVTAHLDGQSSRDGNELSDDGPFTPHGYRRGKQDIIPP